MRYMTTRPIRSLAENGVNVGTGQPVTPGAFAPSHWAALLAEGVIVADEPEPATVTAVDLGPLDIDALKALADEVGVTYTWNIKAETLRERLRK